MQPVPPKAAPELKSTIVKPAISIAASVAATGATQAVKPATLPKKPAEEVKSPATVAAGTTSAVMHSQPPMGFVVVEHEKAAPNAPKPAASVVPNVAAAAAPPLSASRQQQSKVEFHDILKYARLNENPRSKTFGLDMELARRNNKVFGFDFFACLHSQNRPLPQQQQKCE